ncbi:ribonuclease D [Thalassotalea sp. PLHSN55]|uniref:ribonuclease D n=1 Tax=Thalassotalea sp. PLHSN55 TaxID=3435888 RepID=UPI003F855123
MQNHYIQDNQALVDICQLLAQSSVLAVDTEFVRTRTLYPKLGLLQVCNGEQLALIDPISITDLSPFWQLLTEPSICKVLHACSEDLEVFLTAANCKPVNMIDSQIMMSFLGHGLSLGYAAMINHYTEISLDKSESRTDWTKRPLTERQLTYAQADVDYLYQVYPKVLNELTESGWLTAAQQETQAMIDKKFVPIDADNLYKQVKMSWKLNTKQLNLLKALATWRFEQAKKRNLPIGFVAKDHTLMALAKHNPQSLGAMMKLEGVEVLDVKHKGNVMLSVLNKANKISSDLYPDKIIRLDEYTGYKQTFKKVKNFIATVAEQSGLQSEVLASKKQINQFLTWHYKINGASDSVIDVDILQSWRHQLFGEQLQKLAANNFQ